MATLLKLVSGEQVICDFARDGATYLLRNPAALMLGPQGLALAPFMFTEDSTVELNEKFVMIECSPEPELTNSYNARFGSGIVVVDSIPESKLIL